MATFKWVSSVQPPLEMMEPKGCEAARNRSVLQMLHGGSHRVSCGRQGAFDDGLGSQCCSPSATAAGYAWRGSRAAVQMGAVKTGRWDGGAYSGGPSGAATLRDG